MEGAKKEREKTEGGETEEGGEEERMRDRESNDEREEVTDSRNYLN